MQLLLNGLIAGSLAALIAGGLALVYGVMGIFNMALGQTVLMGGYITWWLYQSVELPLSLSIVGGMLGGIAVSWVVYGFTIRPFYKFHRFLPIVTTIAAGMMLDGIMLLAFEERPRSILPGLKNMIPVLGGRISSEQIALILATVLLLIALAYILHSTAFGRKIRAVVQHDHAAMSIGIHASRLHLFLFLASGFLAACGGIFIGIDSNLTPTLAFPLTIKAYAAIIAGGKGNVWGAVVCAYGIAFLEQLVVGLHWFGAFYIPAGYQHTVALAFIIVFLIWKPEGIFASRNRTA